MNKPFVPLAISNPSATAAAAESFHPRLIPGDGSQKPFRPILESLCHSHAGGVAGSAPQPKVTLKRDGDRVTHICIRCACGEEIELACVY